MDPFLEHPDLWPDVHLGLIAALRDSLAPRLRPKYRVAIEKRAYFAEPEGLAFLGRPDVSVVARDTSRQRARHSDEPSSVSTAEPITVTLPMGEATREGYLEVRDVLSGDVITVLELRSPSNKKAGDGRAVFEAKRQRVLASATHLVEIDLLRGGQPMPTLEHEPAPGRYSILVSRSPMRPAAKLYSFSVRDAIPVFSLPLASGDEEPAVDLSGILHGLYGRAGYDLGVDYRREPEPALPPGGAAWADVLLRSAGLRR
jgi:hypothetical protein